MYKSSSKTGGKKRTDKLSDYSVCIVYYAATIGIGWAWKCRVAYLVLCRNSQHAYEADPHPIRMAMETDSSSSSLCNNNHTQHKTDTLHTITSYRYIRKSDFRIIRISLCAYNSDGIYTHFSLLLLCVYPAFSGTFCVLETRIKAKYRTRSPQRYMQQQQQQQFIRMGERQTCPTQHTTTTTSITIHTQMVYDPKIQWMNFSPFCTQHWRQPAQFVVLFLSYSINTLLAHFFFP